MKPTQLPDSIVMDVIVPSTEQYPRANNHPLHNRIIGMPYIPRVGESISIIDIDGMEVGSKKLKVVEVIHNHPAIFARTAITLCCEPMNEYYS